MTSSFSSFSGIKEQLVDTSLGAEGQQDPEERIQNADTQWKDALEQLKKLKGTHQCWFFNLKKELIGHQLLKC